MRFQLLSVAAVVAIVVATSMLLINHSDNSLSDSNELATVRQWNVCQQSQGNSCDGCPKKEHAVCFNTLIDTNNCMLRDTDVCIQVFNFIYNSANIDLALPDTFSQCVAACDKLAQADKHFYSWFTQKFYVCSQAQSL